MACWQAGWLADILPFLPYGWQAYCLLCHMAGRLTAYFAIWLAGFCHVVATLDVCLNGLLSWLVTQHVAKFSYPWTSGPDRAVEIVSQNRSHFNHFVKFP